MQLFCEILIRLTTSLHIDGLQCSRLRETTADQTTMSLLVRRLTSNGINEGRGKTTLPGLLFFTV